MKYNFKEEKYFCLTHTELESILHEELGFYINVGQCWPENIILLTFNKKWSGKPTLSERRKFLKDLEKKNSNNEYLSLDEILKFLIDSEIIPLGNYKVES